jgi:hypothetical protein
MINYYPGDIELKTCLLYNYKGDYIDFRHILLEYNIFYDLFSRGTRCELIIADSNGLIELFPIIGEETLVLQYKTPTSKELITNVFHIYSITDREKIQARGESYILKGVSQEIINNDKKTINKTYKDIEASKLIEGIYTSFLKPTDYEFITIRAKKDLILEETNNTCAYIFGDIKPFDAIRQVLKETKGKKYTNSNFVFFENSKQWTLATIDSLLEKDPVDDFYYAEASVEVKATDGEKVHEYQRINSLEFLNQIDILKNMTRGLYQHTLKTIDPLTKTYEETVFDYNKDKESLIRMDKKYGLMSSDSVLKKELNTSKDIFILSDLNREMALLQTAKTNDMQLRNPKKTHEFISREMASRLEIDNFSVNIAIPGNTLLEIGDVINIHIPQTTQNKDLLSKLNLLYSKKFLITALRHTYNKTENVFFTTLECAKGTYGKDIT